MAAAEPVVRTDASGAPIGGATSTYKNASGQVVTGACRLMGFSIRETAGAASDPAALVYLRDGTDATGTIKAVITLAPNESDRDWFGMDGVAFATGIYFHVSSGAVEASIWSAPA